MNTRLTSEFPQFRPDAASYPLPGIRPIRVIFSTKMAPPLQKSPPKRVIAYVIGSVRAARGGDLSDRQRHEGCSRSPKTGAQKGRKTLAAGISPLGLYRTSARRGKRESYDHGTIQGYPPVVLPGQSFGSKRRLDPWGDASLPSLTGQTADASTLNRTQSHPRPVGGLVQVDPQAPANPPDHHAVRPAFALEFLPQEISHPIQGGPHD